MDEELSKTYEPLIKEGVDICGIAAESMTSGETGKVLQRAFIHSLQEDFWKLTNNILSWIAGPNAGNSLNKLLVIIGKDNIAKIYHDFPVLSKINPKVDIEKGMEISKEHIIDIETIKFSDGSLGIDIQEGDKVIWLFRLDWKFGLYFDFSGKLKPKTLYQELAACYRLLLFYNIYLFLENKSNLDTMLQDGWFPFIQLTDENFEKLSQYYLEDSKYEFHIDEIIKKFTKEKIESMTKYWWSNTIFNSKKTIIEAGISAYLQNSEEGYLYCIKTLVPEAEGIIREACFNDNGKNRPSFADLKNYITNKGLSKFSSVGSLAFPKLFYDYLSKVVFKGFNMANGEIPLSRHSVSHGVAKLDSYSKIRAFQMILILDQIYFFLGK